MPVVNSTHYLGTENAVDKRKKTIKWSVKIVRILPGK